jgi:hypothetical protein
MPGAPPFPPPNALERQILGVEFLEDLDDLATAWREAGENLRRLSQDATLHALAVGGPANLELARERARQLVAAVDRELALLQSRTAGWADEALARRIRDGVQGAADALLKQGAAFDVAGSLGPANEALLATIADEILIDAEYAAGAARRTMQRHFRLTQQRLVEEAAINQSLLVSEARMENMNQRAKRLARVFQRAADNEEFIVAGRRRYSMETYARLVGSTRMAEAASEASLNYAKAVGTDLVQVSDHGRTDPACDAHAGKIYSISGRSKRFPALRERPPYHPHCRHVLTPFVEELASERELTFFEARSRDKVGPGVSIEEFESAIL